MSIAEQRGGNPVSKGSSVNFCFQRIPNVLRAAWSGQRDGDYSLGASPDPTPRVDW